MAAALWIALLVSFVPAQALADGDAEAWVYPGTCGASAGVSLMDGIVIVGSDDDNILRTFSTVEPGPPVAKQSFYKFLEISEGASQPFSAIEGAASNGEFVFWVGSHSRTLDGRNRPHRRRLFATKIIEQQGVKFLAAYGRPILDLAQSIEASDALASAGLAGSIKLLHAKFGHLSPEIRGFNIQGLTFARDGKTLLVALRNPDSGGAAVIVPILNPVAAVEGERLKFGAPIRVALGGLRFTAIEYVAALDQYLMIVGTHKQTKGFKLYRWSGLETDAAVFMQDLPPELNAEGMYVSADAKRVFVLSDDSEIPMPVEEQPECRRRLKGTKVCGCTYLRDEKRKAFRAQWVSIDSGAEAPALDQ